MKNLEPKIYRKRLTIEAHYSIKIHEKLIGNFLKEFAAFISMTPLTEPLIFSPNNLNHPLHHGIAGFIAWAESGCSVYTWDKFNFLTVEIYTCKKFDDKKAIKFVNNFFKCKEIQFREFSYNE